MGFRVLCHGIDSTDGSSLMSSENDGNLGNNSLIRGHGVSGYGDSGGVKKFSSTSFDLCSGFSRSSANMLRNWYSSSACSSNSVEMWTSLGSKRFLSRLYWISGIYPMYTLWYIWYVLSVCLGVTKCSVPYMLLMYQLRSSSAEIAVCPQASRIRVDVVVWAIVSEYMIYQAKFFLESVWLCVGNSVSEINFVKHFPFF